MEETPTEITVNWYRPIDTFGNFYKSVFQFSLGISGIWITPDLARSADTYTITNLPYSVQVLYRLRAVNNCGEAGPVTEGRASTG